MSDLDDLKVILLGESGVGKTNLINRVMGEEFNEGEISTTNSSFSLKKLKLGQKEYSVKLWDTIGQEKFRHLTKLFYSDSKIVIFVYDISIKESFDALKDYWVKDINDKLGENIIKGVVGNKKGEEYAKSINARFLATSAKTEGPQKFEELLTQLLGDYLTKIGKNETQEVKDEDNNNNKKKLKEEKPKEQRKRRKC